MSSVVRVFAVVALMTFPSFAGAQGVDTVWVRQYTNLDDYYGNVEEAVVDSAGNLYLAGYIGEFGIADLITVKFRSNGDTAWVRRYDGTAHVKDVAKGIAVDAEGNVYVSGFSRDTAWFTDIVVTIKYDSAGDIVWLRTFHNELWEGGDDVAEVIAVDSAGNVIVAGRSGVGEMSVYLTLKYDGDGDSLWVDMYGASGGDDVINALTVDHDGNIYVSGNSAGFGTGMDYATIKYAPDGERLWIRRYDGPDNGDDLVWGPGAIGVDDSGNVYVTGISYGGGAGTDCATIKYRSDGVTDWVSR